jgi:hypothetical protein
MPPRSIQPEEKDMPGPLSNLFGSDDGAENEGATRVPVSSIDSGDSDTGDGTQHEQSFQHSDDGGESGDAPAFSIDTADAGGPGAPSDGWLEPQ